MSFLDALIYGIRDVLNSGSALNRRSVINFGSGLVAVDDSANGRTNVTASVGAPTGTGLVKVVAGVFPGASSLLLNADVDPAAAVAWSKLGTGAQNLPAVTSFVTTVDAKSVVSSREPVHVQTTTLTTTTLVSFTRASGTGLVVTWLVNAIKSDFTQHGAWSVSASFRNNAGTVTQQGSTVVTAIGTPDDAAWAPVANVTGTTIRLQVPGKAAITVQWGASGSAQTIIP